jgi:hypothetical protein
MIVDDGYNKGRNFIVEKATSGTRWKGRWWKADVEWKKGLIPPGKNGMRQGIRVVISSNSYHRH